jgi:hypothetical protein
MTKIKDFVIVQGSTFSEPVRWETEPIVYKAITGITQAAPAVVNAIDHGLVSGWNVAIVSVKGMTEINASNPPADNEYVECTVVDDDHIELNTVNAADYKAYKSSGYVQYNTPKSLAGYIARMSCKNKIGGTEFLRLDTTNGGITIDNAAKTITLFVSATDTALLVKQKGVYDLELESPAGVVTKLLSGSITVSSEVTTT